MNQKRLHKFKQAEELAVKIISGAVTYSLILVLLYIIWVIFSRGMSSLSWEMASKLPSGGYHFGGSGGVLNAIVGSLLISVSATAIAIAIGVPAALYINVHLDSRSKFKSVIRYALDTLWGIPSIVYGAFGFAIMLLMGLQASLIAGIITIALLITPILTRCFDEVLQTIPRGLHEAALALGSTRSELAIRVIFKQGFAGFITAMLLAFGRGIGDAASVLFTAGYTDRIPEALDEPAATLPLAIFFQLGSPIPEVRERAYAAAIILTVIILIISISARIFSWKSNRAKMNTH
jgi:phosphate transport system permease protein